jgi:hypothetical protein
MDKYQYLKEAANYRRIYYTSYLKVFVKQGIPPSSLINNWKFDLISQLRNSALSYSYIFSDFRQYSAILENADVLDYSQIIDNIYSRKNMHYEMLEPMRQSKGSNVIAFPLHKPLEKGSDYLLLFAVKTNGGLGNIFLQTPNGEYLEIKIDDMLRLFVLPVRANRLLENSVLSIGANCNCNISKPIIIKFVADESFLFKLQDIFKIDIDGKTFSFNPYLDKVGLRRRNKHFQFLTQDKGIYMNPMIVFMRLFNFTIPGDLLTYSWKNSFRKICEVKAVRY